MLTIRQAQLAVFAQAARTNFIERMVAHLRSVFTEECDKLGDAGLRELIESGIRKATTHGIEIEGDVAKYLTLCVGFGPNFEQDPNCSWAREVLSNPEIADPSLKAQLLYEAALEQTRVEEGIAEE